MSGFFVSLVEGMNPSQAEMMRQQMEMGQTFLGALINAIILADCW